MHSYLYQQLTKKNNLLPNLQANFHLVWNHVELLFRPSLGRVRSFDGHPHLLQRIFDIPSDHFRCNRLARDAILR